MQGRNKTPQSVSFCCDAEDEIGAAPLGVQTAVSASREGGAAPHTPRSPSAPSGSNAGSTRMLELWKACAPPSSEAPSPPHPPPSRHVAWGGVASPLDAPRVLIWRARATAGSSPWRCRAGCRAALPLTSSRRTDCGDWCRGIRHAARDDRVEQVGLSVLCPRAARCGPHSHSTQLWVPLARAPKASTLQHVPRRRRR